MVLRPVELGRGIPSVALGIKLHLYSLRKLCRWEEFDFDPAGLAAVEEFVGFDGGGERLEIRQHRGRIDYIGANRIISMSLGMYLR